MNNDKHTVRRQEYSDADVLSFIAQSKIGGIFQAEVSEGFPILYANEYYYRLHGYTKKEFEEKLNNKAEGLVLAEDFEEIAQKVASAVRENRDSIILEYRVTRGDGKIAWMHASAGLTRTESGFFISGMVINIDERKNAEQSLLWSEKRFKIAIEHTHINVWEYDIASRCILQSENGCAVFGREMIISNVPESQIKNGVIHPADVEKYTALYKKLCSGEETAGAVIRINTGGEKYRWEKISYTNIFGRDGRPVRAVAVSEDISQQMEAEQRFYQEEHLREMLSADMLFSVKINFSDKHIEHIRSEYYKDADLLNIGDYGQLTEKIAVFITKAGDRKRFLSQFSQEALENAVQEGRDAVYGEYRCCVPEGRILWCAFRLVIMCNPMTLEQMGFLYIRDIDERKKTELALKERAEKDALTGLYNRQTVEYMIIQRLERRRESSALCAMFIVDLDEFKQVNDRHGHYTGDKIIGEVGRILREESGWRSIAGRLGGDEFVVFSDRIADRGAAEEMAVKICRKLNIGYTVGGKTLSISASVGVAATPLKQADFKTLFQQADAALYDAKTRGKSMYTFFGEGGSQKEDARIIDSSCIARSHLGERCMLDHIDDSVLIIDEQTHDVLFMNSVAREVFSVTEYLGKKCYDILYGYSKPCVFCQSHLPGEDGFKAWENLNTGMHKRFMIRDKIIMWDGRRARLEIFTDVSGHEQRLNHKGEAERVLLHCAALMLNNPNLRAAIRGVLEHLGKFYQADRAYYAKTEDMRSVVLSDDEWRAEGVPTLSEESSLVESGSLHRWLEGLRCRRVAVFGSIEEMAELFPFKYAVLKKKGVESFAAVAILDENGMLGYIGLENPRVNLDNTTLLKSLSYFLHNEISKRRTVEKLKFSEEHDSLTGLLNWRSYLSAIDGIVPEAVSSMGVLVADINHLRVINQDYGAEYGDRVLKALAEKIKENFPGDLSFRFAGDAFVTFCQDITYEVFLEHMGRLQRQMDELYPGIVFLGCSWSDDDIMPDWMINRAEEQLALLKQREREASTAGSRLRLRHLKRLQKALAERRFEVYLQPKAAISGGEIRGAEALVRYRDEKHGIVPPVKFIPKLEAEGNICLIDFFVLEEVCAMLSAWKRRGLPQITVSLNFSRLTLMGKKIVEKINEITGKYGVDRALLEIEITERTGNMEHRALIEISRRIISAGYRLSLDDFGSEYSNISTLASLPLKALKLDKSVISDLYSNSTTKLLVKNMINVCNEIGIDSIAEGVEEKEQLEILRSFGCTYAQGYLFNKPLPVRDFERKYLERI